MITPAQEELFAVIGNPVQHSLSPIMMNAAFRALGLAAHYTAFVVEDLAEGLQLLLQTGFRGLSVTLPHKEEACRVTSELDETARNIGAVNTLRRQGDHWEARNTDWIGAIQALRQVTRVRGRNALVIGAGGSARAVVYGLKRDGVLVTITNRTPQRGAELASALQCHFVPFQNLHQHTFDILVQCTPHGMEGTGAIEALPDLPLSPEMVAMDLVYRPYWTPFLQRARDAGCKVVSGLDMLLYQGVAQFEWWLGQPAPIAVMKEALWTALARENHDSTH
jgi:shikimate dehydrogenase